MYSFIDSSGCVFLNADSGETLSVGLSESELTKLIVPLQGKEMANSDIDTLNILVKKCFLKPLDTQG